MSHQKSGVGSEEMGRYGAYDEWKCAISEGLGYARRAGISRRIQGHVEVEFLCPVHISRTSCCPLACGQLFWASWLWHTPTAGRGCFVTPQQHQVSCGSKGINSPSEARVRFLRDFCELKTGRQGSRARTRDCSLGRNEASGPGQERPPAWMSTNTEEKQFLD